MFHSDTMTRVPFLSLVRQPVVNIRFHLEPVRRVPCSLSLRLVMLLQQTPTRSMFPFRHDST
jgi:hypothetical protein